WSEIVREWLTVKSDRKLLQGFVNLTLAEAWEEDGIEQMDYQLMYRNRREHYDWEVPDDVNVVTLGIDVQDDRFEMGWVGWGEGEEAWNLRYQILQGDLAQPIVWQQIQRVIRETGLRKQTGEIMRPTLAVIDHGGHYSKEVEQLSKALGAMFLMPAKGLSVYGRPIVTVPRKRNANGVYLLNVGTDTVKNLVHQRLQIEEPGPGFIHWPRSDEFDEEYFKQFTAEKRIPKWTGGVKRYVWDAEKRRNEPWDVFMLNVVAVHVLQQRFGLALDKPIKQTGPKESSPAKPKRRKSTYWN
ncbi:MAG: terminase gpA endonuclease subunit, partial [Wenzhouxiangella sp.]